MKKRKPSQKLYDKASVLQSSTIFAIILHINNRTISDEQLNFIYPKLTLLKNFSLQYISREEASEYLETAMNNIMKDITKTLNTIEQKIANRYNMSVPYQKL